MYVPYEFNVYIGSLVALPKHERQRYADKILSLITPVTKPVCNYVLQSVEYNETNPDGSISYNPVCIIYYD